MPKREYDVIVIGAGPGGYVAAIRAAQLGLKTACIEKESTLGGTCLNVGCIPSKALLQSSEYYELMQKEAKEHGIGVSGLSIDFQQIMQRKSQIVKGLVDGVASLFKRHHIERIEGTAKFVDPHSIEVDSQGVKKRLEADHVILASGSEPIPLPFLPFDEKTVLSSTGALSLPFVPKSMLMVGAGVIGVELASVYNRLGTKVKVVEMLDRICNPLDITLCKALQRILEKQGLKFYLSAKVLEAKSKNTLTVSIDQKNVEMSADVILVAIGRRPYTKGLGLESIGINIDAKGFVVISPDFRTSVPHIYAIGDIVDGPMLAHKASEEGMAAAEIIAGLKPHVNYMAIPSVIYTHPEAASVGMTESEAKEAGLELKIGTSYFKGNPRARCTGYTEGFVKIMGEAHSGRLAGLHIIGMHASEMIGEGVMAMEMGMTLEEIARASHAHPTLLEAIKEAALSALGRTLHG